jgi:hypothetical protein
MDEKRLLFCFVPFFFIFFSFLLSDGREKNPRHFLLLRRHTQTIPKNPNALGRCIGERIYIDATIYIDRTMYTVTKGGPFFFSSSAGPVSGQWEAGRGARIKTVFSFSYFIFIFLNLKMKKKRGKKGPIFGVILQQTPTIKPMIPFFVACCFSPS